MNDIVFNALSTPRVTVPILGGIDVQILSVIAQFFIALIALFGVYIAYWISRYTIGPNLDIRFNQDDLGLCHRTRIMIKNNDWVADYYFRFYVINTGKSIAKHCEIIIEKLWFKEKQNYERYQRFAPMNLKWTGGKDGIIDINPDRTAIGNIGHIPKQKYQDYLRLSDPYSLIDLNYREASATTERFIFELTQAFYAFPNSLAPGDYILRIGLYSENAKNKKIYIRILWTGQWEDDERSMFEQIKITDETRNKELVEVLEMDA